MDPVLSDLYFEPILLPVSSDRRSVLRTMVLGRQIDSGRPQTRRRGIDQKVSSGAPGTSPITLLHPNAAQTVPGASQHKY